MNPHSSVPGVSSLLSLENNIIPAPSRLAVRRREEREDFFQPQSNPMWEKQPLNLRISKQSMVSRKNFLDLPKKTAIPIEIISEKIIGNWTGNWSDKIAEMSSNFLETQFLAPGWSISYVRRQ